MKNEWKIVDEFLSNGIQCFIAEWKRDDYPDRSWAGIGEEGFYQYNGYCVIPYEHPDWSVVNEYEYDFLKTHLKRPEKIVYYKKDNPQEYDVHGGITYRDRGYGNHKQYSTGKWIIGFDTAHLGDFENGLGWSGYKKSKEYVKNECKRLADLIVQDIPKEK